MTNGPSPEERRMDDIVDKSVGSYFEAQATELGYWPDATPPSPAKRHRVSRSAGALSVRRARTYHGPRFGEESGVGFPEDTAPELLPRTHLDDAERARFLAGLEACKNVLRAKGIYRDR